ncbi:MAG: tetratricopeptide repeat protein [Deltaproteobacteria bacterium]|nr:tetratricopeptide repeat protein [Deltaproteobacteria bacterium]
MLHRYPIKTPTVVLSVILIASCCICRLVPSAKAETLVFTATYNYIFDQLETEDQARVTALAKTRQAIFKAAGPRIQKSPVYKNLLPVENLSNALASVVLTFETNSLTVEKAPQGHAVSLKLIGRLNIETFEKDMNDVVNNPFLFDNALSNRNRELDLLDGLEKLKEKSETARQREKQNTPASEKETSVSKAQRLVNQLSAVFLNDTIIAAALEKIILDPGEIIKRLNRAVAMDDHNAWLYLHRGRTFSHLKDRGSASADFDTAALLNPYLIFSYEFKGDVLLGAGETEDAIKSYNKAIALNLQYEPTLMKRGRAYREMHKNNLAAKDFTRVINIDPANPACYMERGDARYASGEYAEAAADFAKALNLNPDDGVAYANRGRAWMAAGQSEKACDDLKKACELGLCDGLRAATATRGCLSLDPAIAAKWSQTCYEEITKGAWNQAIQTATLAIYYNPDAVNPYINRSWAYAEVGAYEKAIEDSDAALRLAPGNAMAFNNRGLVYEKKGNLEQAGKDYLKACEIGFKIGCRNYLALKNPSQKIDSEVDLLLNQSKERYRDKDWNEVIRLTSLAITKEPENYRAYTIRADAYNETARLEEALVDSGEAIRLNPSFGPAYNSRGSVLEHMGKLEEARVDYRVGCLLGADVSCQNQNRLK